MILGQVASVILAAGKGTRMKSQLPKVMHKVCGKPMLSYVIEAASEAGSQKNVVVVGHGSETVKEAIGSEVEWVYQEQQLGTGHAVMQAEPLLSDFDGEILVLCGDTPLITPDTLKRLLRTHQQSGYAVTVLTSLMDDPTGYGRIIRDVSGHVQQIVEHRDASPDQLSINEINSGIYCFEAQALFSGLKHISPANAQGEYYLTDVLSFVKKEGYKIGAVIAENPSEIMGINNRVQLARAEKLMRRLIVEKLMMDGVTVLDPETTYIDAGVIVGQDTVILPNTIIEGRCRLGQNCCIGPNSRLKDVETGDFATIQNSVIIESTIGNDVTIGPFSYLRPGTVLKDKVKVGDFVEIKKSFVGYGSKVPHLSYIGDAQIGAKVNVGAGTITCNYDGVNKWQTVICDNAFIGSNTNLVAPVEVGEGAVIGAGSTITKNVPENTLCVERSKQAIFKKRFNGKENKK